MALSIRLEGLSGTEEIGPGGSRRIAITVTNISAIVDQYILALTGLDESWFTLAPRAVSLFPNASARVEFTLHPPTGKQAVSGDYPFTLLATSSSDPTASTALSSTLRITAEGKPGMEVRPLRAEGRKASFRAVLKNPSNAPVAIELAVRDAEDGLRTLIDPVGAVPVPPGEERAVQVTVRPRRRETVGNPHPYELEFLGLRPGTEDLLDPGLKRFGQYTYVPPMRTLALPLWLRRLPLWALLALLLLLLAVLFLSGRQVGNVVANPSKPPATLTAIPTVFKPTITPVPTVVPTLAPPPTIGSFGVKVDPKGDAALAWSVRGAKKVALDGKPVAPTGQTPLTTTKAQTYVLSASASSGTVSRVLQVVPPPIKKLSVSLPTRHVDLPKIGQFSVHADPHTGALSLTWQIQGAERSLLNGTPVSAAGSERVSRGGPRTYILKALNGAGITTSTLILPAPFTAKVQTSVLALPAIGDFALQHPRAGQPYALTWHTTNATSVTLDGTAVAKTGSLVLHPPLITKRYVLVARNGNGQVTGSVQVTVK